MKFFHNTSFKEFHLNFVAFGKYNLRVLICSLFHVCSVLRHFIFKPSEVGILLASTIFQPPPPSAMMPQLRSCLESFDQLESLCSAAASQENVETLLTERS